MVTPREQHVLNEILSMDEDSTGPCDPWFLLTMRTTKAQWRK